MVEIRNTSDPENAGRDHHPNAYTMWLAGGGIKGGQVIGKTDDLGFNVVEDKVHVHDLQATILHNLGFDHTRLTYKHMGREFRLTDVAGEAGRPVSRLMTTRPKTTFPMLCPRMASRSRRYAPPAARYKMRPELE